MKLKKLALSDSKLGLEKLINEYFYSHYYIITDDLKIYNSENKKLLEFYIVKVKGRKWYLYTIAN